MRWLLLIACVWSASAADLTVTEAVFRRTEDGPGTSPPVFRAGEPVYLSFRISGFGSTRDYDPKVQLVWSAETTDPEGRVLPDKAKGEVNVELAPEDKDWKPLLRYMVVVPPVPEPGRYMVKIAVEDKIAGKTAAATLPFTVEGAKPPAAGTLSITNLQWLQREDDGTPMAEPLYAPGSTVWIRFDIGGYSFGPQNSYEVHYGVELVGPTGKVLFSQPNAAADSGRTEYPKLFVSAMFSLNLAKDALPGEYRLILRARDAVGGREAESAYTFRVR